MSTDALHELPSGTLHSGAWPGKRSVSSEGLPTIQDLYLHGDRDRSGNSRYAPVDSNRVPKNRRLMLIRTLALIRCEWLR
jgi:hypothetical protein